MDEEFKIVCGKLIFEKSRYDRAYFIKPDEPYHPMSGILGISEDDIEKYIKEHFGGWRKWDNILRFSTKEKAQQAWDWCNSIVVAKQLSKR